MLSAFLMASSLFTNSEPEVRGTWLTTTANEAISRPEHTAETMRRLRDIGLNTVYVEVWKNGYTEFPSETMARAIGVPMRVNASPQGAVQRDLLEETLIEAHRNQLIYIAWFEYGFMAAHQGTQNELRARKDWLSLDAQGGEVAGNGFVWMNPLHPDAQDLLLGIVKEAIVKYDLDGIQLDDRIVWPYINMGYDDFTRRMYRQETGREVPADPREPQWGGARRRSKPLPSGLCVKSGKWQGRISSSRFRRGRTPGRWRTISLTGPHGAAGPTTRLGMNTSRRCIA